VKIPRRMSVERARVLPALQLGWQTHAHKRRVWASASCEIGYGSLVKGHLVCQLERWCDVGAHADKLMGAGTADLKAGIEKNSWCQVCANGCQPTAMSAPSRIDVHIESSPESDVVLCNVPDGIS
jgi:hypothetical protein